MCDTRRHGEGAQTLQLVVRALLSQRKRPCCSCLLHSTADTLNDGETPGPAWRPWCPDSLSTRVSWWEPSRCTCSCGRCGLREISQRSVSLPSTNFGTSKWSRKRRRYGKRRGLLSLTWSTLITQVSQRCDWASKDLCRDFVTVCVCLWMNAFYIFIWFILNSYFPFLLLKHSHIFSFHVIPFAFQRYVCPCVLLKSCICPLGGY